MAVPFQDFCQVYVLFVPEYLRMGVLSVFERQKKSVKR